jgi:hypothetical protein
MHKNKNNFFKYIFYLINLILINFFIFLLNYLNQIYYFNL